jgi:hypothetical protein
MKIVFFPFHAPVRLVSSPSLGTRVRMDPLSTTLLPNSLAHYLSISLISPV